MKKFTTMMDCHGHEILKFLNQNKGFKEKYETNHISLNLYVMNSEAFCLNDKLDDNHIKLIKETDVLILQVIEKDRGFLNNSEVIKFCKPECKIIKIPHYRSSNYFYKTIEFLHNKDVIMNYSGTSQLWKLPKELSKMNIDINIDVDKTINVIKDKISIVNTYNHDKNDMLKTIERYIEEFKSVDSLSDISMFNYFIENYKKYRLFQGRSYPSSRFFYELTNKILSLLNIKINDVFKDLHYAFNTSEPIPEYWHKFNGFLFDNTYYTCGNIPITEYEWFYILLLSKNRQHKDVDEIEKYLKIIRKK